MKKYNFLLIIFLFIIIFNNYTVAQILNPSFENWTSGEPNDWVTANVAGLIYPVTKTSDAQDGSFPVRMKIVSYLGYSYSPYIQAQDSQTILSGHPVSTRYSRMSAYIKSSLLSSAQFRITIFMLDQGGWTIGGADSIFKTSFINWTRINIPIEYYENGTPASMYINFALYNSEENDSNAVGSMVFIDNLSTEEATTVQNDKKVLTYSLEQNYPNPFNPSTTIQYSIETVGNGHARSTTNIILKVYDVLGREVTTLVDQKQPPGKYSVVFNANDIQRKFPNNQHSASAIYFYRLQSGNFVETKKMLLLK